MITFHPPTEQRKQLVFGDVLINEFFVCMQGCLYQKSANTRANMIATSDGTPYATYVVLEADAGVDRIIPVGKIEF